MSPTPRDDRRRPKGQAIRPDIHARFTAIVERAKARPISPEPYRVATSEHQHPAATVDES